MLWREGIFNLEGDGGKKCDGIFKAVARLCTEVLTALCWYQLPLPAPTRYEVGRGCGLVARLQLVCARLAWRDISRICMHPGI